MVMEGLPGEGAPPVRESLDSDDDLLPPPLFEEDAAAGSDPDSELPPDFDDTQPEVLESNAATGRRVV